MFIHEICVTLTDMKRFLILCAVLIASVSFAYSNSQAIILDTDPAFRHLEELYISRGIAMPSTASPYSMDEVLLMLEKIRYESLSSEEKKLYETIVEELGDSRLIDVATENLQASIGIHGDLEVYARTTPSYSKSFDYFGIPGYKIPKPVLELEARVDLVEHFSTFVNLGIGLVHNFKNEDAIANAPVMSNMILLPPADVLDSSANTPTRASLSAGGSGWNIEIGRNKVDWGPGVTGNFLFGPQLPYNDMLRLTGYTPNFKYSFISSFFVHPKNYFKTKEGTDEDYFDPSFKQADRVDGISMLMAHRLEFRIVDKLRLSIAEAILYQNEENYLDLRVFNPVMIYHNYYLKGYANSILLLDFDFNIVRGVDMYAQFVLDDLAIPFVENDPSVPGSTSPNAIGAMLGMNLAFPREKGIWTGNFEFVYTSPFLYLRNHALEGTSDKSYGLSFITGIREYGSEDNSNYNLVYMGYRYGGDAIVLDMRLGYESYARWNAGFELFYMAHGTVDIYTRWREYEDGAGSGPSAPTDSYPGTGTYHPDGDAHLAGKNAVEHTIVVGGKVGHEFLPGVTVSTGLDLITVLNTGNRKEGGTTYDLQWTTGISYRY